MKLLYTFTLFLITTTYYAQTPLYLGFVSHNEWSDDYDYENSLADFETVTDIAREIADTVISKEASWNIQVDANYILAVLEHENGATNPNDFLEWYHNTAYIDVDCHNHFDTVAPHVGDNPYNYSDLAHLLDSCGIVLNEDVVGGYTWLASEGENWTQFFNPVPGNVFPSFSWYPNILWGGAIPGHTSDDIDDFGLWNPTSPLSETSFKQHNASGNLTHVGNGCKDDMAYVIIPSTNELKNYTDQIISNIKDIADHINNQTPQPNQMYTANIMMNFRDLPNFAVVPSFADSIAKIIDGLQSYVNDGKIVWSTIAEKYTIWNTNQVASDFFIDSCESMTLDIKEYKETSELKVYPNPTSDQITVSGIKSELSEINIYNTLGQNVNEIVDFSDINSTELILDLTILEPGIYYLKTAENMKVLIKQ